MFRIGEDFLTWTSNVNELEYKVSKSKRRGMSRRVTISDNDAPKLGN